MKYSNFEYLNIPGKELNVNKFTEQIILFQENLTNTGTLGNTKYLFIATTPRSTQASTGRYRTVFLV